METPQQNDCATEHALVPKGQIEHHLGNPESEWTTDDLIGLVSDCGIKLISLMHIGGDGWLKTLDFVPHSIDHVRDILEGGERADGSSIFPSSGIKPGASDVILRPNIPSAFLDPFSPRPTLALLCRHLGRDGNPLPESPDTILRKADERIRSEITTELQALGEPEYFLGKRADEGDSYGKEDKGYHATSPFVFGQTLRREAMAILADMGVPVKYGHSEVGYVPSTQKDDTIWEQHEVELQLDSLPEAAEAVVLTQWVLRNLAHSKGMRCSFDPVIRRGHAGSGQHYHISAVRDDRHLFTGANVGDLSAEARWLIGGLVQMGGALMAFGNRDKGSFTRLLQGKEAPNAITWGSFNRLALIRLPIQVETGDGRVVTPPTIEFRLPDGSAHPYLVLAGIAQAMILGRDTEDIETLLERTRVDFALNEMGTAAPVPKSFREVASALRQYEEPLKQGDVFPESLLSSLGKRLLAERE
ncbi:hypothetical protein ACFL3H_09805 [Gemmatimonadota bacterium]